MEKFETVVPLGKPDAKYFGDEGLELHEKI